MAAEGVNGSGTAGLFGGGHAKRSKQAYGLRESLDSGWAECVGEHSEIVESAERATKVVAVNAQGVLPHAWSDIQSVPARTGLRSAVDAQQLIAPTLCCNFPHGAYIR